MPPSYWKVTLLVSPRSSTSSIFRPRVRKAVSRRRSARVSKSKPISSKISRSGRKVILVPCSLVASPLAQLGHRFAALVVLRPDVAVAADLQVQALGERVDDRDADAVQAAGDLVAAAVPELAAGVEDRQHDLGRRALLFLHRLDRDAAAVVGDRAAVVRVEDDADAVAVAGEGLVDRVVDDLVDEVMEPAGPGRADVHAGTLADRFQALEDGDVLGAVGRSRWRCWIFSQAMSPFRLTQKTPTPGGSLHTGRGIKRVAIRIPVECCGRAGQSATNSLQIVDKMD